MIFLKHLFVLMCLTSFSFGQSQLCDSKDADPVMELNKAMEKVVAGLATPVAQVKIPFNNGEVKILYDGNDPKYLVLVFENKVFLQSFSDMERGRPLEYLDKQNPSNNRAITIGKNPDKAFKEGNNFHFNLSIRTEKNQKGDKFVNYPLKFESNPKNPKLVYQKPLKVISISPNITWKGAWTGSFKKAEFK